MKSFTAIFTVCFVSFTAVAGYISEKEAYGKITKAIRLRHRDIRIESLKAIKSNYEISDDDFSSLLIRAAEEYRSSTPAIRGFALGTIKYFGTTNALDYLKSEALYGPSHVNALFSYCIIAGFNRECFDLAERVFSSDDMEILRRKAAFCTYICSIFDPTIGERYGRTITEEARVRTREYLTMSLRRNKRIAGRIDEVFAESDSVYAASEERRRYVAEYAETLPTNSYDYAYFQTELAKLKKEEQEAEKEAAATTAEEAKPQAESNTWLYSLISLAAALAITAGIALRWCRQPR